MTWQDHLNRPSSGLYYCELHELHYILCKPVLCLCSSLISKLSCQILIPHLTPKADSVHCSAHPIIHVSLNENVSSLGDGFTSAHWK